MVDRRDSVGVAEHHEPGPGHNRGGGGCVVGRQWYVAVTTGGGEFLARNEIASRSEKLDVVAFLPLDRPREIVRTSRVTGREVARKSIPVPLLRGYIFVSFDLSTSAWRRLYGVPGVERLLGMDPRRPQPIPSAFVDGLMRRAEKTGVIADPIAVMIEAGARVRVVGHTLLEGQQGTVNAVKRGLVRIDFDGFTWDAWMPSNLIEEVGEE